MIHVNITYRVPTLGKLNLTILGRNDNTPTGSALKLLTYLLHEEIVRQILDFPPLPLSCYIKPIVSS